MLQVHFLDLNASNASQLFHIIGPQCLQCIRTIPYFGPQGTVTTAAAAAAATAAAVSQELWTFGGALVQRAQEQNIPCGESLTSIKDPPIPQQKKSEFWDLYTRNM